MIEIHKICVPTPYPVGPVNSYLIRSQPYVLVDPGPETPEAKEVLRSSLNGLGVDVSEIKKVFLTHSHSDHSGLATWVSEQSGAEIYVHPYEFDKLNDRYDFFQDRAKFVLETGIPASIIEMLVNSRDVVPKPMVSGEKAVMVRGGEKMVLEDGVLEVLPFPGHACGHVCLFDRADGNFFSGDFLLPDITPNPLLEPDPENPGRRMPSLKLYMQGLQAMLDLDIKVVWPGHGDVINDYRTLVLSNKRHHEKRLDHIRSIIKEHGRKMTVFQVSSVMYHDLRGIEIFLGLSEVQAHLDVLKEYGELVTDTDHRGVVYYQTA